MPNMSKGTDVAWVDDTLVDVMTREGWAPVEDAPAKPAPKAKETTK